MASAVSRILKKTASLAGATFASRILGFCREILMAAVLGGGAVASAWGFAFKLPNMTRRIFGEGLLGTVLITMLSRTIEKRGKESARKRFSTVSLWLTLTLCVISILVSGAALIAERFVVQPHLILACKLIPLLMPYCIFICLIGVITAVLNSAKVFFLPAILSLLLNICMIAALLFVCPGLRYDPESMLSALGISVLISGILELILILAVMKQQGLFPVLSLNLMKRTRILKEVWALALPGLLGALAYDGSVFADTLIAGWIGPYAIASLSYSERLIYLPIGVFAVAFGTVSLAEMSRLANKNDYSAMIEAQFGSLKYLLFVTIPLTVFMYFFARDILQAVYMRGQFDEIALNETMQAMGCYVLGIPAFASLKVILTGFYARKDMRTPMLVSVSCMALNLILNLLLMKPMRQGGIALATAFTSYLNNILLLILLQRAVGKLPMKNLYLHIFRVAVVSLISGGASFYCAKYLFVPFGSQKIWPFEFIAAGCIVFAVIFLLLSAVTSPKELKMFITRFIKRKV